MKRIGVIAAAVLAAFIGNAAAAEPLATRREMTPQSASEERPAEIFVRALRAIEAQEEASVRLHDALLEYFAIRLTEMPHAVWIGDTKAERTAFVFVDYSAPFAFRFLRAVEQFAAKANVRCIVLPGSIDTDQQPVARFVAGVTTIGEFPALFEKGVSLGDKFDGDVVRLISEQKGMKATEAGGKAEALDQAALARLVLLGLGAKHPTLLRLDGKSYAGSLVDPEEMAAFFSRRSSAADASVKAFDEKIGGR
jgi:hypothetical protein